MEKGTQYFLYKIIIHTYTSICFYYLQLSKDKFYFLIKKKLQEKSFNFFKGYDRWPQNKTESSMTWFVYKKKKESQIDPKWNFVVIVIKEKCSFRSQ